MSEVPKCLKCRDTGVIYYYDIDGMTIYRWQKPKKKACDCIKRKDGRSEWDYSPLYITEK